MKSLRERRHEHTLATIAKQLEKRDAILAQLCRAQTRLAELYRQRDRYERIEAKNAAPIEQAENKPKAIAAADDCSIPDFLQRKQDGEMRDKIAADAIRAEQEERRRNKARVRIETMKAKQSGASKQMPLQGKDALKAIHA